MKLKKVICLATAATMLMGSAAFAEVPKDTMIIGNQAFNIRLMFDPSYKAQILDAMRYANANPDSEGNRPYYYKINQMAQWRTVFGKIPLTEEQIGQWPEITYINADGESTVYQEGNGDPVEDNEGPVAEALTVLAGADSLGQEQLLAALQAEALELQNVKVSNAAAYVVDSVDIAYGSTSVAAVQAAVDATNARIDINAAANVTDMEAGITAFINAKIALGNLDAGDEDIFNDEYLELSNTEKLAIAKMVLSVRNENHEPLGFGGNGDLVWHAHCNGLLNVIEERESWITGVNSALEETVPEDQIQAVIDALNNIPTSLVEDAKGYLSTAEFEAIGEALYAEYRYDSFHILDEDDTNAVADSFRTKAMSTYPEGFTNLADILATLDEAIAELPAE
ncbi:hypothetical protein EAL2_c20580 [Peptoclostridium acidaminophilum DSM 3953]|uniref:Uncharacterized protein n=1 Tax=Peptoclostridium acidaminophilum DSM 3953 TaxID=1286171 RepID=W8T6G2_PEPAC|nr:hypothetical protein [Peptoclostridium acidaminophilum]AHM57339.1 hypothetical protein EAL2_c20580 [Peptoclostridium acidaminophilum DSM 3953]